GFSEVVQGPQWSDAKGWNLPQYGSTVQFADVNGDGQADVCCRRRLGYVCALSNENNFTAEIQGPPWGDDNGWAEPKYYATLQLADVNGDGKADACGRGSAGLECYLSDGTGAFPTLIKGPAWSDAAGWDAEPRYATIQFADVNGDGKADVCA